MDKKTTSKRYSDEDLQDFKVLIDDKLKKSKENLRQLLELAANDANDLSDTSPTYKALEEGSNVFAKENNAQMAVREQKFIRNLEAALIRIENKTYGISRVSGELIPKERLRLVPHATTTIEEKENEAKQKKN